MEIQGFNIYIKKGMGPLLGFHLVSSGISLPYGILHKIGLARFLGTSILTLKLSRSSNIVLNLSEQTEKDIYI